MAVLGSLTALRFLLLSTELIPLLVCAKEPVPPAKCTGIVTIEVVVVKVVKSCT